MDGTLEESTSWIGVDVEMPTCYGCRRGYANMLHTNAILCLQTVRAPCTHDRLVSFLSPLCLLYTYLLLTYAHRGVTEACTMQTRTVLDNSTLLFTLYSFLIHSHVYHITSYILITSIVRFSR